METLKIWGKNRNFLNMLALLLFFIFCHRNTQLLYFVFHITFIASDMRQATYRYLQEKCRSDDEGRVSGNLQKKIKLYHEQCERKRAIYLLHFRVYSAGNHVKINEENFLTFICVFQGISYKGK